jgi:hypothetical protein
VFFYAPKIAGPFSLGHNDIQVTNSVDLSLDIILFAYPSFLIICILTLHTMYICYDSATIAIEAMGFFSHPHANNRHSERANSMYYFPIIHKHLHCYSWLSEACQESMLLGEVKAVLGVLDGSSIFS